MKLFIFALYIFSITLFAQPIVIAPGQTTTTPSFACPVYTVTCSGTPCDPTKPPPDGCGPPPIDTCDETMKVTIGSTDYTRQCSTSIGNISYNGSYPTYGGPLVHYETLWGAFAPVGSVNGNTFKMPTGIKKFVSLAFVAKASGTNRFTANISSGLGGMISVSTKPGVFASGSGYVCGQSFGGSNSLSLTSNNSSANCKLTLGATYYLNFAPANSNGTNFCADQAKCNIAYTIQKTN